MQPDQAADFVAGIMRRNDVEFGSTDDGRSHRVIYGSTAVHITFAPAGDDDTTVSFAGIVLEELDSDRRPDILEELNRINCSSYFGKFCLYDDTIRVEWDMMASRMQAEEFMGGLGLVARHADEQDDALQQKFGGRTWQQVDEAARAEQEALDT